MSRGGGRQTDGLADRFPVHHVQVGLSAIDRVTSEDPCGRNPVDPVNQQLRICCCRPGSPKEAAVKLVNEATIGPPIVPEPPGIGSGGGNVVVAVATAVQSTG